MVERENTLSPDLQMWSPNKRFFLIKLPLLVSVDRVLGAGNLGDEAS